MFEFFLNIDSSKTYIKKIRASPENTLNHLILESIGNSWNPVCPSLENHKEKYTILSIAIYSAGIILNLNVL